MFGMRYFFLTLPLAIPICNAVLPQFSFEASEHPDSDPSPFIFNSLFGLLKQWPNTLHPTGHSIVPVSIAPQTLLYHARTDTQLPPSPEWFGLSPEVGFSLPQMAPSGEPTYMLTYRTTRAIQALVFDGLSAFPTKLDVGWLDNVATFIYGAGKLDTGNDRPSWGGLKEEYERAQMLCQWAKTKDVDAFIRMNSGFEVIWCNFESSAIELINHLNVTPLHHPRLITAYLDPGTPDAPPVLPFPFFSLSSFHEWGRVYSAYNMAQLPFLTLHPAGMVTYYNPRLTSLSKSRLGLKMAQHRIWPTISRKDALSVRSEVEDVVGRSYGVGSGTEWTSLVRFVVENWAHRIGHVRHVLSDLASSSHSSVKIARTLEEIQLLTFSPLMPYMDTASANSTGHDLFFSTSPDYPYESALDRCSSQYTKGLRTHTMTSQEKLLKQSIEIVQARICRDFGTIFAQSYDFSPSDIALSGETFSAWFGRIASLSNYLDWPTDIACDEVCGADSVCALPLWPWEPLWPELHVDLIPTCQKIDVFGGPETWRKLWSTERNRNGL